jgi:hypothetical protein
MSESTVSCIGNTPQLASEIEPVRYNAMADSVVSEYRRTIESIPGLAASTTQEPNGETTNLTDLNDGNAGVTAVWFHGLNADGHPLRFI